ncbi:IPT/TIG domain-containing protein [Flavihumibacter sp. UBA7668]|uniref:IPT/TIG domain-containing protein n=1 Tax=Flavihumibacter sp. UBA7668 TaxID=1946542 RepID=UPI0025C6B8AF|nr:IPT/TIG domain-containing protein [Flavihumibacter sp. UBA7668]
MRTFSYCWLLYCCLFVLWGCQKDDAPAPIPIAPILKEIVFPGINEVMPGREATIRGKGFDPDDKIFLENETAMTEAEVTSVNNQEIRFLVPEDAGGAYTVTVERHNLQTTLDGELIVPLVVVIDNLSMPTGTSASGSVISIGGEGFQNGDEIQLTAAFYPEGKIISIPVTVSGEGIQFEIPSEAYGQNTVTIVRGQRRSTLGTIGIEVQVGDEIGGGIVYYVESNKIHGFIVHKENLGTATESFGPGLALSGAAGTGKAIGSGKSNTAKLQTRMAAFRQNNNSWNSKKAAFELCDELTVTSNNEVYADWFLPSQEELIELFKVKDMLWTKGAGMPANNYWSSSEADGDAAGWAAFYVNFYEPVNVVSGFVDKEGWKIGIRPVRYF